MATPKRKHSFGLASRLAVIGAFVGFGSWAVFNSKFKKDDSEEIAKAESESGEDGASPGNGKGEKESKQEKEANNKSTSSNDSKAQPASFVEKTKPGKIKLENKNGPKKKAKSSVTFSPSSSKTNSKSSGPPSSSFSLDGKNKSGGSGGFSPPSSKSFSPSTSSKSSTSKAPSSSGFPGATSFSSSKKNSSKKADDKRKKKSSKSSSKGPPSSGFSPGITSKAKSFDPGKSTSSSAKKKSGLPPSSSFAAGSSKSGPPSSTFNPGRSKSSSGGFGSQDKGKSAVAKSGPPSTTFDPRGNFSPPSKSGSTSFASSKSTTKQGAGGGFQSRPSDGKERPLRSVTSGDTSKNKSTTSGATKTGNPAFSLSSDNRKKNVTASPSPSRTNSPPTKSSAAFSGGSAFQDKGSKPLEKNSRPKTNNLNKSNGNEGIGSSSTGFADIGNRNKTGNAGNTLNLDPQKLNPRSNANTVPSRNAVLSGNKSPASSNGIGSRNPVGSNAKFAANPNFKGAIQSGADDKKPGPSSLEGIQTPAVTLQKLSPREIQVDVEATFKLIVRNVGRSTATNLMIVDPVPDGTQFVSADPAPSDRGTDGSLIWKIGALDPNQQKEFNIKLLPKRQGEIGSVARMSFQAAATAKAICTKPEITVTHSGPQKILKGQTAKFRVTIQNNGDGIARDVVIEDEVPAGFAFGNGQGSRLAYEVGNLPPGARREVTLSLRAVEPGRYVNEIRAKMGKTTMSNHKLDVEVTTPKLKMEVVGPTRRYIQREARYSIEVKNNGTASARNVLMVTRLPKGMKFVRTNNRGQYNPREHSVYWSMVELSPQNKGAVELVLMPMGTGQQEIEFEAKSMLDRTKLQKFPVVVDQLAELFFEVDDRDDPIEVNGETEYRIRVVNQGSKAASDVVVAVEMPIGIQATDTKGPTKGSRSGEKIVFAPVNSLQPRGELIYRIKAKGTRDGNHLIKVLLSSKERREAVAKQESTKVYSEYR